ncbi:MAG: alpha-glucan family phosphorylase [Deltaproteobacteria bacterium]|nr:MAG: alpha-glucan family phosphorylase [Deltaproteobacteria bacterium]
MTTPRVAYFCMEYGLSPELAIYSGGLGVLAGDTLKSAGDLGLPVTGIGILWSEGYTRQTLCNGQPVDSYPPTRRDALEPVDAAMAVTIEGERVALRAFRVTRYTTADLFLLEPVEDRHRWITRRLYGGDARDRVAQEIVLGVGGVRLLRALGREVDVYHFNEGHAVFAGHELIREHRARGATFEQAWRRARDQIVFTTHTPVPAGNEVHAIDLLERMGATLGLSRDELGQIGGDPYGMTVAGLRLARAANAVAKLHAQTARDMWRGVSNAAPIDAITNGVHPGTWQDPDIRDAAARRDTDALWAAHVARKRELLAEIERRTGVALDPNGLVAGFARRAATYKRADLAFGDPERLERLFARGLQLVYAGKAHPRDLDGKRMVARVVEAAQRWPRNVVFLENYDMQLGALLTRGCDVWLNNPRRPLEASGTSGMKAAMNGVLNCSILDGWWPEGCRHGETGWKVEADHTGAVDEAERDRRDRDALYRVLEEEVLPAYADRARWLGMMAASIDMAAQFSSDRMVRDYYARLYRPAAAAPRAGASPVECRQQA